MSGPATPQFRTLFLQPGMRYAQMVVNDQGAGTCDLFEIKRADQPSDGQYRHLEDAGKQAAVERIYGRVASRTVLYRGVDVDLPNGIRYRNVGDYLKSLGE